MRGFILRATLLLTGVLAAACTSDSLDLSTEPSKSTFGAVNHIAPDGTIQAPHRPNFSYSIASQSSLETQGGNMLLVGAPADRGNVFPFGGKFGHYPGTRYQQAIRRRLLAEDNGDGAAGSRSSATSQSFITSTAYRLGPVHTRLR